MRAVQGWPDPAAATIDALQSPNASTAGRPRVDTRALVPAVVYDSTALTFREGCKMMETRYVVPADARKSRPHLVQNP
jgi:hypothetical protein